MKVYNRLILLFVLLTSVILAGCSLNRQSIKKNINEKEEPHTKIDQKIVEDVYELPKITSESQIKRYIEDLSDEQYKVQKKAFHELVKYFNSYISPSQKENIKKELIIWLLVRPLKFVSGWSPETEVEIAIESGKILIKIDPQKAKQYLKDNLKAMEEAFINQKINSPGGVSENEVDDLTKFAEKISDIDPNLARDYLLGLLERFKTNLSNYYSYPLYLAMIGRALVQIDSVGGEKILNEAYDLMKKKPIKHGIHRIVRNDVLENVGLGYLYINPEKALEIVSHISWYPRAEDLKRRIIKELVKINPKEAVRLTKESGYTYLNWKAEIIADLAEINPDLALELFDEAYGFKARQPEVRHRPTALDSELGEIFVQISDSNAKSALVKALAKKDPKKAIRIVKTMYEDATRSEALAIIAEVLSKKDPKTSQELFNEALKQFQDFVVNRLQSLLRMAVAFIKTDPQKAEQVFAAIIKICENPSQDELALIFRPTPEDSIIIEELRELAKIAPDKAIEIYIKIRGENANSIEKIGSLPELAKKLIQLPLDKAYTILENLVNNYPFLSYEDIIYELAKIDIVRAYDLSQMLNDDVFALNMAWREKLWQKGLIQIAKVIVNL